MANLEVNVKKAVDWIAAQLRENPGADRSALVDQASQRFGLSPLQAGVPVPSTPSTRGVRWHGAPPKDSGPM